MKKLSITNLTKTEKRAIEILQKYYGEKTKAGAVREAITDMAIAITVNSVEQNEKQQKTKK